MTLKCNEMFNNFDFFKQICVSYPWFIAALEVLVYFYFSIPALTNEDFRKLLMTPRSGAPSVAPPSAKPSSHSLKSVPSSIHSHRISR